MASECPICILPIEKAVECSHCQYKACVECVQTCITTSKKTECINCRVPYTYPFIHSVFPKGFIEEHIDTPGIDEIYKEQCALITLEMPLKPLIRELSRLRTLQPCPYMEVSNLKNEIAEQRKVLQGLKHLTYKCSGCTAGVYTSGDTQCPSCKTHNCLLCETAVNDPTTHECKTSDLDTITAIRINSKRCPKCRIWISKIEGCNQMFCIECKTPFDWTSGKVIRNGGFHNPHYMEYLNNGGQGIFNNQGDRVVEDDDDEPRPRPQNVIPISMARMDFRRRYVLKPGEREKLKAIHSTVTKIWEAANNITWYTIPPTMYDSIRDSVISGSRGSVWLRKQIAFKMYERAMHYGAIRTLYIQIMDKVSGILMEVINKRILPTEGLRDISKYIDTHVNPEYSRMDALEGFPTMVRLKV